CPTCARLTTLELTAPHAFEHSSATATLHLDRPAPAGGALVFLSSANPLAASVPASVTIPAGATAAAFTVTIHHAHDGPAPANLPATYGASEARATLTVQPIAWQQPPPPAAHPAQPAAHHHTPPPAPPAATPPYRP